MQDLTRGFRIETPAVFVPWATTREQLKQLLVSSGLTQRPGYYELPASCPLKGLKCDVGFFFGNGPNDLLKTIQLYRDPQPRDQDALTNMYEDFHDALCATFGNADERLTKVTGYKWTRVPGAVIQNMIYSSNGLPTHVASIAKRTE